MKTGWFPVFLFLFVTSNTKCTSIFTSFWGFLDGKKKKKSISWPLFQNENRSRFPFSIFKCSKSFNKRLKFRQHIKIFYIYFEKKLETGLGVWLRLVNTALISFCIPSFVDPPLSYILPGTVVCALCNVSDTTTACYPVLSLSFPLTLLNNPSFSLLSDAVEYVSCSYLLFVTYQDQGSCRPRV